MSGDFGAAGAIGEDGVEFEVGVFVLDEDLGVAGASEVWEGAPGEECAAGFIAEFHIGIDDIGDAHEEDAVAFLDGEVLGVECGGGDGGEDGIGFDEECDGIEEAFGIGGSDDGSGARGMDAEGAEFGFVGDLPGRGEVFFADFRSGNIVGCF